MDMAKREVHFDIYVVVFHLMLTRSIENSLRASRVALPSDSNMSVLCSIDSSVANRSCHSSKLIHDSAFCFTNLPPTIANLSHIVLTFPALCGI